MCFAICSLGAGVKAVAGVLTPEAWLIVVAVICILLATLLSFIGSFLTKGFLGSIAYTNVALNDDKTSPEKGTDPSGKHASAIALVDIDLQLEHHQRGRCIVQAALILAAIVAVICSTMLELQERTPPKSEAPAKAADAGSR